MKIFVAGAAGAIGKHLVPMLTARGHRVIGTTRSPDKAELLRRWGAEAVVLDGLDGAAVGEAVARAEPDVIVHQMTSLSGLADLMHFDRWFASTNELRTRGTEHLLAAARASGVRRFVAQSYTGWNNARTGGPVKTEEDAWDTNPASAQIETMNALRFLEKATLEGPFDGLVLRYGNFYGPGSSDALVELVRKRQMPIIGDGAGVWSWIHLEDAARATAAAIEAGLRGVHHVTDDEPACVSDWLPYLAEVAGAKKPLRIPTWVARIVAGEVPARWMTEGRGASNAKLRAAVDWSPKWPTYREGFRDGLGLRMAA